MHVRFSRTCSIGLLIAMISIVPGLLFADMYEMVLDISKGTESKLQRPTVAFNHDLHMNSYDCLDCHHNYQDGENILDPGELEEGNPDISCTACHNKNTDIDAQEAFHRQCTGCHTTISKTEKKALPLYCGECHKIQK